VNDWTSQIYGVGEIGALADVSEQNLTLHSHRRGKSSLTAVASGALHGGGFQRPFLITDTRTVGGYVNMSPTS
jgi:hypothetical protein